MAAIYNDRDLLLQAAAVRDETPPELPNVFLTLSSVVSVLPADSNGIVTSYGGAQTTVKVMADNTDDTANWTITTSSQNVTVSRAGNTFTVTGLSGLSGYVDFTATRTGYPTLTARYSVAAAKAGTNGTNGTNGTSGSNGQRGTVQVARAISGSSWSNTEAASAISAAGYGSPVNRDLVTLYNTGASYSETRFYDYGSWLSIAAYVNGNMLVDGTLSATKLNGGTITGVTINIGSGAFQVSSSGVTSMSGAVASVMTFGNLWNPGVPPIKAQPVSYSTEPAIYAVAAGGNAFKADGPCYLNGNVTISGSLLRQGGGSISASVTYADSAGSAPANGGTATSATQVMASGNAVLNASNGTYSAAMQTDGNFVVYGRSVWASGTNVSDSELKDKVADSKRSGLGVLKALRVVDFRWKPGLKHLSDDSEQTGFIAQEVEKIIPNAVREVEHPDLGRVKFLHKEELVPVLVKAVQELSELVDKLTARVAALEPKKP